MDVFIAEYNDTFRGHGLRLVLVIQARDYEAAGILLFEKLKRYNVGLRKPRGMTYESYIASLEGDDVELTLTEIDRNPYVLEEENA